MKWEWIDSNNKISNVPTNKQIDTLGNILQINGAVQPVACQKCTNKFDSIYEKIPIIEKIFFYKCKDCDFSNSSGDKTLEHKIEQEHIIEKISSDRIIGYEKKLKGIKSNIQFIDDDVVILCNNCMV